MGAGAGIGATFGAAGTGSTGNLATIELPGIGGIDIEAIITPGCFAAAIAGLPPAIFSEARAASSIFCPASLTAGFPLKLGAFAVVFPVGTPAFAASSGILGIPSPPKFAGRITVLPANLELWFPPPKIDHA